MADAQSTYSTPEVPPPSPPEKGCIRDARARHVSQLDPVALRLLARHDVIPAEPLREIAEALDPGEVKKRWVGLIKGLLGVLIFAVLGTIYLKYFSRGGMARWRDPVWLMIFASNIIGPPIAIYFRYRFVKRARHERICRVMLEYLRCPHCGYDLRGLPSDPADGATVCPECGCAWMMEAQGQTGEVVDA